MIKNTTFWKWNDKLLFQIINICIAEIMLCSTLKCCMWYIFWSAHDMLFRRSLNGTVESKNPNSLRKFLPIGKYGLQLDLSVGQNGSWSTKMNYLIVCYQIGLKTLKSKLNIANRCYYVLKAKNHYSLQAINFGSTNREFEWNYDRH